MDDKDFSKLDRWLDNLAAEVVLAEPNSDQGLLPIRELFANLRDKSGGEQILVHFHKAATDAVSYMESTVMDGLALFTAEHLDWIKARIALLKQMRRDPSKTITTDSAPTPAAEAAVETPCPAPTAAPALGPAAIEFEQMPLVLDDNIEGELLKEFFSESNEHLENIEQGALVLEDNPRHKETLDSIFRAFHSFKGGAGFLNLRPMNRLAHELESLLDLVREGKREVSPAIIEVVLKGGDLLREYVIALQNQVSGQSAREPIIKPVAQLIGQVRSVIEMGNAPAAAPAPVVAATPTPAPAPVEIPATPCAPTPVAESKRFTEVPPATNVIAMPLANATAEPGACPAAFGAVQKTAAKSSGNDHGSAKSANGGVVKVDTMKLDSLVDLVGEMVIAQSMVSQDPDLRALQCPRLMRNMTQLNHIVNDLQRTAMSMRMVPIRATFQKMNRLVRDVASKVDKQVELKLSGEDTELDRTIIDEIGDPLIHMVRNAVDHGIEKPDIRLANGKPPVGTLHMNAFHQGGSIVIQITDDGAGLNEDRILAKAIEKGIVNEKQQLSKKEIFGLIFAPGFSTAEKVSDLSGRGVGMDVVRSNIEKLRGKVDIDSTPGKGAVFTIYLPLTLAIIDGLIVAVGEENYILPTLSVRESFRPRAEMISTVHERGEMVNVRGHLSPLLRLYEFFGIKPKSSNPENGIIIVIESGNQQRCLLVDDLVGKQEVVIKSLGGAFKRNKALSGASILGDGRVGLILDVSTLVSLKDTLDPTAMAA